MRLCREEYIPIPSPESIDAFVNYFHQTRLDPSRNRRLTAPPFLALDLNSEVGCVKYFLTKMDLRREIIREFSEHELAYATIDGGEAWGRRKQVTVTVADNEVPTSMEGTMGAIGRLISEAGY